MKAKKIVDILNKVGDSNQNRSTRHRQEKSIIKEFSSRYPISILKIFKEI